MREENPSRSDVTSIKGEIQSWKKNSLIDIHTSTIGCHKTAHNWHTRLQVLNFNNLLWSGSRDCIKINHMCHARAYEASLCQCRLQQRSQLDCNHVRVVERELVPLKFNDSTTFSLLNNLRNIRPKCHGY